MIPLEKHKQERGGVIRVGFGYDVHRFAQGRRLMLGGVRIPSAIGLEGHSDADVLLHAICDALLGAAALGDIGTQFPNTSRKYKNIPSLRLLGTVARMLRGRGWTVVNIDSTVLLDNPKIMPYAPTMRARIARTLRISPDLVSVKATSNEGMGFVGRGEGCGAFAVVSVRTDREK